MTILGVFDAIESERKYQTLKWGLRDGPRINEVRHEVGGFITLIRNKVDAAESAWCGSASDDAALEEIRKVAALSVACLEQHGCKLRDCSNVENMRK